PGLQAGCMKQLTTTLNLGNSLLNGKSVSYMGIGRVPRQLLLMQ
ncbi:21189_t:CDS:1, partial [Rhizophagus irregularis]